MSYARSAGLLGVIWLVGGALAAEVEVTPVLGARWGGGFDTRRGDLEIDPGASFGLIVSFRTRRDGLVELLYSRQETTLDAEGVFGESGPLFDLNVETLHFGGLWEIRQDRTRPFLGLSLGGTRLDPQLPGVDDEWAFSAGISGGGKFFFSERAGLRLEGRGLLHLFDSSGAIFCGFPPGQCGLEVAGDSFLQIEVAAGLTVVF